VTSNRAKLRLDLETAEAVEREFDQNLRHGRAFLSLVDAPPVLSECLLVLSCGGTELELPAQVVMVDDAGPAKGVGVAIMPFDDDAQARLQAFIGRAESTTGDQDQEGTQEEASEQVEATEPERQSVPVTTPSAPPDRQETEARHVQLRKLSLNQQQKVARTGDLSDRVAVERLYGKSVWGALLQNPKLTVPEVAKIARKGTVPRPLLDVILDNKSWLKASPVRRALMSNPRTSSEGIMKLLRMTPKHELKLIHRGTSYSAHIREQARKLLD